MELNLIEEGDSPEDQELLRQAEEAIRGWVAKRVMEGATVDDLRREMEAICDVADLRVLTGAKLGHS